MAFGTESVFEYASTHYIAHVKLDSTHVVVAYRDSAASNAGRARVGTISGSTISWGTVATFATGGANYVSMTTIDSTHVAISYGDLADGADGVVKVATISGTSISFGSVQKYTTVIVHDTNMCTLDSTHVVVVWRYGAYPYNTRARVGTVSGSTITWGAERSLIGTNTGKQQCATLDSTHFVTVYRQNGGLYSGYAMVSSVAGTTITPGSASAITSNGWTVMGVEGLSSSTFVVGYHHSTGYAKIGSVSGTTISWGSAVQFNAAATNYVAVSKLDSSHFAIGYMDDGGADYGCARIGTFSGSTISSYDTEVTFNSAATNYIQIAGLATDHYTVAYRDEGSVDYGCARVWGAQSGVSVPCIVHHLRQQGIL